MFRLLLVLVGIGAGVPLLQTWTEAQQTEQPPAYRLATPGQPIAGIPYEEAIGIFSRHKEELRQLDGAISVSFTADGLAVETANPAALPAEVEGSPVFPIPPVPPVEALPEPAPDTTPLLESQSTQGSQPAQDCGSEAHWNAAAGRCERNIPLSIPPPKLLPPPPGVIVLRANGVQEQADSCPQGFEEATGLNNWRSCIDPKNPLPIPPLMAPPIAGITYEKALEILERHRGELTRLPGVESVGMGADGLVVETANPAAVPAEVEGLPIKILPPTGPMHGLNHTLDSRIRPIHEGVAISDTITTPTPLRGTLAGIGLSQGNPWLIFSTPHNIRSGPLTKI